MTYTSNVPLSGQTLGATRPLIETNFQQIATVMAVNHEAFNASGEGKHKFVQLTHQGSDPATAASEVVLYNKLGAGPAEQDLFMRAQSSSDIYQLTRVDNTNFAKFATSTGGNSSGWTFLPGGMLLQYGSGSATPVSSNITFPKAFTNAPYSVTIGQKGSNQTNVPSVTTTNFSVITPSGTSNFYWMAIGV
jgi:hypothetical protein